MRSLLAVEYERLRCICCLPAYRKQEETDKRWLHTAGSVVRRTSIRNTARARTGGRMVVERYAGRE